MAKRELPKIAADDTRDLVFFDETALTLRGVVPYRWQPIGERWFRSAAVPIRAYRHSAFKSLTGRFAAIFIAAPSTARQ